MTDFSVKGDYVDIKVKIAMIIQDETPTSNHWESDSLRATKRIFEYLLTGEYPPHSTYPHEKGYLIGCPNCEDHCHCTYGNAVCVFEGEHVSPVAPCKHCAATYDCDPKMNEHCPKCGQCDFFPTSSGSSGDVCDE